MSPWEVIGWTIAIPMALMTVLFVGALIVATFKALTKPPKKSENHPAGKRHLRLVEDD
jgi:hypothetical protein